MRQLPELTTCSTYGKVNSNRLHICQKKKELIIPSVIYYVSFLSAEGIAVQQS